MAVDIQARIRGTRWGTIIREFFTNTAHFPTVLVLIELLPIGPANFFRGDIGFYALLTAALTQSFFLGSWEYAGHPRPLLGNLIAPAIYSVFEVSLEGLGFFSEPRHIAYWSFALAIGLLQELRLRLPRRWAGPLAFGENLIRTNILLAGFWAFAVDIDHRYASPHVFLDDPRNLFTVLVILLIGVITGLASATAQTFLTTLQETAHLLERYSTWWIGRDLLSRAVADPDTLSQQRRERTVLFADIRGFTPWSETQPPEVVVSLLNAFFGTTENICADCRLRPIQIKFLGDGFMLVLDRVEDAAEAALTLRQRTADLLTPYGMGVGIGLHSGPVVEGLVGSDTIKGYDVVGDVVNTAERICGAAAGGEVLVSHRVRESLGPGAVVGPPRRITVRGKEQPLTLYPLETFPPHKT